MKAFFGLGCLLLATLVVSLGTGTDAQAQYTIDKVRIYVNPDMVAPALDGTPNAFNAGRTTTNLTNGMVPEVANFTEGTLSTDGSSGVLIDGTNDSNSGASAHTAKTGDIIAIAFKVINTGTEAWHTSHISLSGWKTGGPRASQTEGQTTYEKTLPPSRYIETAGRQAVTGLTAGDSFTVVYAYKVRSGDIDEDGGWLHLRDGNKPFQRYLGALNATYDGSTIHYPKIDAAVYTINAVRVYVNPDMVDPASDGMDTAFTTARRTFLPGYTTLPQVANFTDGTLSGGVEITSANAHDSSTPHTAKTGDIIAIAFKVTRNTGTEVLHTSSISLSGWETGGPPGSVYESWTNTTYTKTLAPSRYIEANRAAVTGLTTPYAFTVVYAYRVRKGDRDEDGDWLHLRDDNKPFQRWLGARDAELSKTIRIYYPKIDAVSPTIVDATFGPENSDPPGSSIDPASSDFVMKTSPYELVSEAPHKGPSLAAAVHEVCSGVDLTTYRGNPTTAWLKQYMHGDPMPVAACLDADGLARGPTVDGLSPKSTRFYGVGDTLEVSVEFTEPVDAHPDVVMILTFSGQARYARLSRGTRSDADNKLYFGYTVQEGDGAFSSGISTFWPFASRYEDPNDPFGGPGHTQHPAAPGENDVQHHETTYAIQDLGGNPFTQRHTNSIGKPGADSFRNYASHTKKNWQGGLEHQVDGIRPSVALTKVDEGTDVTGPFTVDIKFYNVMSAPDSDGAPDRTVDIADEVVDIDADALRFTDASGNVHKGWTVSTPEFIGYSYVPITRVPRFGVGHPQSKVYRVTVAPPLDFKGDVAIQVPAEVTMDIARNKNLASNTLTVSASNPLRVVEKPEIVVPPAGAYTAGDKIEVEVTYDRENLRYEGENPPYVTVYLGEEVPANARHAIWSASEDTNSTKVTFAYTVAPTDTVAEAVRVPSVKILVPDKTTLLSGPLTAPSEQQVGTEERAAASGAAPTTVPTVEPSLLTDPSGREIAPVVSETPVVPVIYLPETSDPKAVASAVPREPIVFNELGNGSGDADDWLELRNVTGSDVSLKDWELSIVQDGKKEDTSVIAFEEDVSVPANGLLLLVNTSPDKTSLAGGDDISTADVEKKGSPHLYFVNSGLSLPDDGKFLLILRNAKEKLGLNEAFVDVAGGGGSDTDAFVREQTGDYDTHVWPLQVLQAPGGDTEDALGSGKVWQRAKSDIVGYHRDAWAESAFTGIGYDRKVSASAATAGTPGYPNGAVKTEAATPKGSVTLSEIMFDSGGGTLPQWIELYNNSKTDAINLNRWELEIQNVDSEDLIGRPIVTLTLSEKVIQPNQTLLIVAGPARASSDSYLPADRVYDLLALHEKNLRIKRARDTFLSTEGFYLQLADRNGNLVDEVGNRDSDRRSDDAPAWALPLSFEEGSRSSIIRRYDKGVALPGRKRASWVLASRIKPFDESLHYGHAEDIGTPGHREGGALPVELSSFSMTRTEAGAVVLTWTTESEVDNAGFNLRRSEKRASGFTLLNPALIAGAGTTGERQTYTFTDTSAKPGVEYYYQIEEVAFDGKPETLVTRLLPGPVSASNRMLTTFGALKKRE